MGSARSDHAFLTVNLEIWERHALAKTWTVGAAIPIKVIDPSRALCFVSAQKYLLKKSPFGVHMTTAKPSYLRVWPQGTFNAG